MATETGNIYIYKTMTDSVDRDYRIFFSRTWYMIASFLMTSQLDHH